MAKSVPKRCSLKRTFSGFPLPRVFSTATSQWASGNVSLNHPVSMFASMTRSVGSSVSHLTGRELRGIPVPSLPLQHLRVQVRAASLHSSPLAWTEKKFNKKRIKSLSHLRGSYILSIAFPSPSSFLPSRGRRMLQSRSWHARWDDTASSLWPDAYCRWKDHSKKKSIQLGAAVTHPQKSFHLFMGAVADLYGHPFWRW